LLLFVKLANATAVIPANNTKTTRILFIAEILEREGTTIFNHINQLLMNGGNKRIKVNYNLESDVNFPEWFDATWMTHI